MNWKNLITRSITGIVFVLVMICGTLWNILSNTLLYGLIILLCEREWEQMSSLLCEKYRNSVEDNGIERVCKFVFPIFSVLFFVLNVICKIGVDVKVIFLFPFLLFILMGLWLLFGNKNLSSFHILRVALSFFGILYITIPFTSSIELSYRGGEFSGFYLVILLCMIWISDTGAYLFGSLLGRHRLFERISPKKSWEGFAGSFISISLFNYILSFYYAPMSLSKMLLWGVIVVLFATLGDLFESFLKRVVKIKDSGNLLPGHGGMLDRFDATLFALPVSVLLIEYLF